MVLLVFFFFKQKTAYEMRISDWSSDVCSSDLLVDRRGSRIDDAFGQILAPQGAPAFGAARQCGQAMSAREQVTDDQIGVGQGFALFGDQYRYLGQGIECEKLGRRVVRIDLDQIGIASCREGVCTSDENPVVTVSFKKKYKNHKKQY